MSKKELKMKRNPIPPKFFIVLLVFVSILFVFPAASAATFVDLGTAGNFAVLAGSGITNTDTSTIQGDIGSYPTTTITGFPPGTVNGINHAGDAVTQEAKTNLTTAYNDAAGQTAVSTLSAELGSTTQTSGVYNSTDGTFEITGTLILDAQGNPNAVFIFQASSTLTTITSSNIVLAHGAQAKNIFWQVGSSATLGTNSNFKGNVLAHTSITLTTGTNVEGRLLAQNGAVTLDRNNIFLPTGESSVPEFSDYALIAIIMTVALGFFAMQRKTKK